VEEEQTEEDGLKDRPSNVLVGRRLSTIGVQYCDRCDIRPGCDLEICTLS